MDSWGVDLIAVLWLSTGTIQSRANNKGGYHRDGRPAAEPLSFPGRIHPYPHQIPGPRPPHPHQPHNAQAGEPKRGKTTIQPSRHSSVGRVHNLIPPQPTTEAATSPPTGAHPHRRRDALPRRLLKALLRHHIDLVRQRHNDVLVAAVLEIVRLDLLRVPLDRIRILATGQHLLHIPGDDERPRRGNDRGFLVVDAGIEARGGEG